MIFPIRCWVCLREGNTQEKYPIYKVSNHYVFACKKHKHVIVERTANSQLDRSNL
jgi:hypothetical protein